jgi:hypothetical protein
LVLFVCFAEQVHGVIVICTRGAYNGNVKTSDTDALVWHEDVVALGDLRPWDKNPRKISRDQAKRLVENVKYFGQWQTIAVGPDNEVYDGHQRLTVWRAAFGDRHKVKVLRASRHLTEDERKRFVIEAHLGATGQWDLDALATWGADTLAGFGVDNALVERMRAESRFFALAVAEANTRQAKDADPRVNEADTLAEKWQAAPGAVWRIGDQGLLICGDARDQALYTYALRYAKKDAFALAVTSPPYGVGKEYEKHGIEPWRDTVFPVIKNLSEFARVIVWQLIDLYGTGTQFIEPTLAYSILEFERHGMRPLWIRIWDKGGMNMGVGAYHLVTYKPAQQYEYILALGQDPEAYITDFDFLIAFGGHGARFVRRLDEADRRAWGYSGIWRIAPVPANDKHPAMYPLELPLRCVKMHSDPGDIVLDPFCGSGTTLLACLNAGRFGVGFELSPGFCGVALERIAEAMPGIKIERINGGIESDAH